MCINIKCDVPPEQSGIDLKNTGIHLKPGN